jgi:asparagine N-glycosylation enzyme membrane subunit Stt3
MNANQIVTIIQTALKNEIKVIERIEEDNSTIFMKVEDKVYLITVQERMPVNISLRTFNPQPKPETRTRVRK